MLFARLARKKQEERKEEKRKKAKRGRKEEAREREKKDKVVEVEKKIAFSDRRGHWIWTPIDSSACQ